MSSIQRPLTGTLECMLPEPPSRNNGGSADLASTGLLAYAAGSTVPILDTHSMQLVCVFSIPPPASISGAITTSSVSPYVTSVRWCPTSHDLTSSHSHLLASGDSHGRICLFDLTVKSSPSLFLQTDQNSKLGIQDLCWIQARSDAWIIAALIGPSLLSLFNIRTGLCFFTYDAAPEHFSCIKRDPFDSRHFCAVGLKGVLLSIKVHGDTSKSDVILEGLKIPTDASESNTFEKEAGVGVCSAGTLNNSPATATFPTYTVKLAFSPHWRHILYVTFPMELVVFDLQHETALSRANLPIGCGKFLDVLPDPRMELVYCAHLDGRLSAWRQKEGEQVQEMCMMEELVPSIDTSIPTPSVLAVVISQSDSTLQNVGKHFPHTSDKKFVMDFDNFRDESHVISRTSLLSISDDGKIWNWFLTSESPTSNVTQVSKVPILDPKSDKMLMQISLVSQLHLLSSTVTTLAVPSPSSTTTLAVPLVALGTQNGSIDVIDVSANAVAASFSVHGSIVRGLKWVGNTKLVSFSYMESEESSGYVNKLVVTWLLSGHNRTFRVLPKPEVAPIKALQVSSSGRYLSILFPNGPVEVWTTTETPVMLRSTPLPYQLLEWNLPRPTQSVPNSRDQTSAPSADSKEAQEDFTESFSFSITNSLLAVFEVHGGRIRDFRAKQPNYAYSEGALTAMAYRLPYVVTGDELGKISWWDATTGQSSSFNTHTKGIKRIKFSPFGLGDIAVLFNDNTFCVFDLCLEDPVAGSVLQTEFPCSELEWLPLKNDTLALCMVGADGSFRLFQVINDGRKRLPVVLPTTLALVRSKL